MVGKYSESSEVASWYSAFPFGLLLCVQQQQQAGVPMARSCMAAAFLASLLLLCLLSQVVVTSAAATGAQLYRGRPSPSIDCNRACAVRCSKSSRKKICYPDCRSCCRICSCVPSGTAGNREECACYATLKNNKGTGKCP